MATRMQQRRGTAAQWLAADPVLAAGEMGFETDTNEFRIGDGVNVWSDLSPFKNLEDLGGSLDDYVLLTSKGVANGVASLNAQGQVPVSQLALVIDGAPAALDTLNEIAAALSDDSSYATTIINALDAKAGLTYVNTHKDATTSVHGIANTAVLVTATTLATEISSHASDTTDIHGIADTSLLATTANVSNSVGAHGADTTEVHGISNTANLVYVADLTAHNSDTTDVHGIPNTAVLATLTNVSDSVGAHGTDTTDVHGIANTAVLATLTNVSDSIGTHNLVTTSVHGIADTANLVVTSTLTAHTGASTSVHGIADTSVLATATTVATAKSEAIAAAASAAGTALTSHEGDTTNVHGISNTALLATTADVAAVTATSLGLGNVTNTSDTAKPVSTAQASAIATAKSEAIADATSQVNALLTGAPAALNTLDELAAALGDDANFASSVTTSLGLKVDSVTPISQKTASYTLSSLTERDDMIEMGSGSALTLTIPPASAIDYPIGTSIDVLQTGAGQVTIAAGAGVTVNATPGLKLRTTWSSCTLFKRAANTWVVFGDLTA